MTDHELVKAVLESCGWHSVEFMRPMFSQDTEPAYWGSNLPYPHRSIVKCPPILTSLDACHEVFEKDAPDGYWDALYIVANGTRKWSFSYAIIAQKATPRQRCLAWLRFKEARG